MRLLNVCYHDGGRSAVSKTPFKGDCVCRAIAIAMDRPYSEVYMKIAKRAANERTGRRKRGISNPATGVYRDTIRRVIEDDYGWVWEPCIGIGTGCRVHLNASELPTYHTIIVKLSKHLTCVKGGCVYDTHDPTRGGKRCVYGYWYKP